MFYPSLECYLSLLQEVVGMKIMIHLCHCPEQGVNIDGERYEVKIKGQAYLQAEVINALSATLDIDVKQEREWLETKIPRYG